MKLRDVGRLATANLRQSRRRSVTVILTMAVIFGLVMGVGFFVRGMRNFMIKAAVEQTEKIYISAGYAVGGAMGAVGVESPEGALAELAGLPVEQYDGKEVGIVKTYSHAGLGQDYGQNYVISQSVAEALSIDALREVPDGKIGILIAQGREAEVELPGEFVAVGEFRSPKRDDLLVNGPSPSNLFVGGLWNYGAAEYYILDGVETERYFADDKAPLVSIVVEFSRYQQALKFYNDVQSGAVDGVPIAVSYGGDSYGLMADDFVGHTMSVVRNMDYTINVILAPIIVVLAIIALLVTVSTFVHLIESDAPTIALYKARGASIWQLYLVYFVYLLELCVLAAVLSIITGLMLALGMSVMSVAMGFGEAVQGFFGLERAPIIVILAGVDATFWRALGLMLLVAPVVLLLTSWRFSSRHIAKSLKENM